MLKSAAAPLALMIAATPALAAKAPPLPALLLANPAMGSDPAAGGEAALLEMFAKLFGGGDTTPIDPAQLELGRKTSAALLPEGAYGRMMDQMMGSFMKPILALDAGLGGAKVASLTGMDYEAADKLTEEQKKAIDAIIDPGREVRNAGVLDVIRPMLIEVGKTLETPMREGIARAYARKFTAAQLTEMNGFFATPTGAAYARESFAIQYDPEVLSATMQALPVMITKLMGNTTDMGAKMQALPQERKISALSTAELNKLAELVGRTPAELLAHAADMEAMEAAAKEAAAAAEAAGVSLTDSSEGPWLDRSNWAPADLAKVEELEAKAGEAISAKMEAEEAAIANARKKLVKK
jgi:hypothetical protein